MVEPKSSLDSKHRLILAVMTLYLPVHTSAIIPAKGQHSQAK